MTAQQMENYTYYCKLYDEAPIESNVIFMESHNSIDLAGNLFAIAKTISSEEQFSQFKLYISCLQTNKKQIESLLNQYQIHFEGLVLRESKQYFKCLATAKYLVTDVAYYSLYRKKEGQINISTWHGTPLKTLGYTFAEDSYVVANQKRGFLLADYFVCPNEYTFDCIKKSYQLNSLFKGKILFGGYPRNSIFFHEPNVVLKEKLNLKNKKILVYMPTWRGKVIKVNGSEQTHTLQTLLKEIDRKLPENYVLLAKLHRLNQAEIDFSEFEKIQPFPEEYESYEVLNLADVLITDYSSVMFDFLCTRRKIVLFCYDKEDYVNNRGIYFDIDRLPFPIVSEVENLVKEMTSPKEYDDQDAFDYFCSYENINSALKICEDVFLGTGYCKSLKLKKSDGKRVLVFTGDLCDAKESDSLFDMLDLIQENGAECYVSYLNHLFIDKWYKLMQFREPINQIPFYMYQKRYSNYTVSEDKVMKEIRNKINLKKPLSTQDWDTVLSIGNREYQRFTYENKFDLLIRFAGQDLESLKWFMEYTGSKYLVVHERMAKKAEENYEYYTYLKQAMQAADTIYFANAEVYQKMDKLVPDIICKKVIKSLY
jgi:CDP-glycerol glycerophosphotransferase